MLPESVYNLFRMGSLKSMQGRQTPQLLLGSIES